MVKKYGDRTPAFWAAWNDPKNWAEDEIKAYGAGKSFYQDFIDACKSKFNITSKPPSTQPATQPSTQPKSPPSP